MAKNGKHSRSAGAARGRQPVRQKGIPGAGWLALGGLVVVLVGAFLIWRPGGQAAAPAAPLQVSGKPKLEVDRDAIDFGTVPLNKPVKASFKLINVGDKPLKIAEVPQVKALEGC